MNLRKAAQIFCRYPCETDAGITLHPLSHSSLDKRTSPDRFVGNKGGHGGAPYQASPCSCVPTPQGDMMASLETGLSRG